MLLFVFLGCSSTPNKYAKPSDILEEQALTQTRKTMIGVNKKIKAYISATYLNQVPEKISTKDNEVERFIINLYIPSELDQEFYDKILFIINGESTLNITKLKVDDPLLNSIPAKTSWSQYYLIEGPRNFKSTNITLVFTILEDKSPVLSFTRDYL